MIDSRSPKVQGQYIINNVIENVFLLLWTLWIWE